MFQLCGMRDSRTLSDCPAQRKPLSPFDLAVGPVHDLSLGRIQNMDRGPWTGVHGPPHGPGPWTTPNFQKEIAPVNFI